MSEKSKGDTSSARVVKNPLLSASVTGLSFDDFPNKPHLLPAAPPAPPPAAPSPAPTMSTTAALHAGRLRDPKSLVTVGETSDIDTESLDEINLNTSFEDTSSAALTDPNSNPLWDQNTTSADSILSQAASSFSALPSVASSVFSTFSKRIYSGSTSRERTPADIDDSNANSIPQLDIQPSYTQQPQHFAQPPQQVGPLVPPPPFYAAPAATGSYFQSSADTFAQAPNQQSTVECAAAPPEPPKFYTPTEVPSQPSASVPPPPPSAGQNTYRLSAKKKLYAPIPGFSEPSVQTAAAATATLPPLPPVVSAPFSLETSTQLPATQSTTYAYPLAGDPFSTQSPYPPSSQTPRQEERKAGGLFSLTNLVPTGVLQNLSGFVQSATGTLTQSVKPDYSQPTQDYTAAPYSIPQDIQIGASVPPPPGFYPTTADSNQPPSVFFPAAAAPPPALFGGNTEPLNIGGGFGGPSTSPPLPPPTSGFIAAATKSVTPDIAGPPSATGAHAENARGPITIFDPSKDYTLPVEQALAPPFLSVGVPASVSTLQTGLNLPPKQVEAFFPEPTIAAPPQLPIKSDLQAAPAPVSWFTPTPPQATTHTAPAAFFDVSKPAAAPASEALSGPSFGIPPTAPPGTAFTQAPPTSALSAATSAPPVTSPPGFPLPPAGGQTSFRLQKGTRLYKSPLTSAETAPLQVTQALTQPTTTQVPTTLFNPFGAPSYSEQPTSVPPPPGFFVPSAAEPQSVPLFAAEDSLPPSSVGFFEPPILTAPEQINKEPIPSSFFVPSASEPQSVALFTPEVERSSNSPNKAIAEAAPEASQSADLFVSNTEIQESIAALSIIEPVLEQDNQPQAEVAPTEVEQKEETTTVPAVETITEDQPKDLITQNISDSNFEVPKPCLPPPSAFSTAHKKDNPFRRESTGSVGATTAPPSLANFFTPAPSDTAGAGDFNFFGVPQNQPNSVAPIPASEPVAAQPVPTNSANFFSSPVKPQTTGVFPELPAFTGIKPLALVQEPTAAEQSQQCSTAIGFDNLIAETVAATGHPLTQTLSKGDDAVASALQKDTSKLEAVNSFSNYFNRTGNFQTTPPKAAPEIPQVLGSFFDTLEPITGIRPAETSTASTLEAKLEDQVEPTTQQSPQTQQQSAAAFGEDQRIQNFFNNPPPQENGGSAGDLNYDLIHRGLPVRSLQTRSLASVSNLAEPPSSSCSEFSELNSSSATQKSERENAPRAPPTAPYTSSAEEYTDTSLAKQPGLGEKVPTFEDESVAARKTFDDLVDEALKREAAPQEFEENSVQQCEDLDILDMSANSTNNELAASPSNMMYTAALKHWFYKRSTTSGKYTWTAFSHYDSALLETSFTSGVVDHVIPVEGGRYDVNINERLKRPVYWQGAPVEVRRCSWFYKGTDSKYVPYEEATADLLEEEYRKAIEKNEWHQKIILSMGEQVVFHGPTVIVHFQQQHSDGWGGATQSTSRPRVVKRDLKDFHIDAGESQRVDHLVFMVHGIGSACDLRMRPVEEVGNSYELFVDEFRSIAQQLVQSHYKNSTDMGLVGRIEVLPISWHSHLHSAENGIDEVLKSITLESIPTLRNFTNDTLLDILFYTSPKYCQSIMNTVAEAMNEVYAKYRGRNPTFNGGVSLAGHSLGSIILFDLLCHQHPLKESEEENMENPNELRKIPSDPSDHSLEPAQSMHEVGNRQIRYTMGPDGTGQPYVHYAQLTFQPKKFFALGSPIGMFVTVRGIDKLGLDFRLPTCAGFFNIFHPFDPVAYRIEALVNPDMKGIRPVLIPHHKGRKRMHLELKETMARVGADLKQRFFDTFKTTLDSVSFLGGNRGSRSDVDETMAQEVDKVIQMQLEKEQKEKQNTQHEGQEKNFEAASSSAAGSPTTSERKRNDSVCTTHSDEAVEIDLPLGKLNDSRRVDYVLQEAPLEFINEYIFALSSHVCYWDSEDTILFITKEIYAGLGISPDSQVPQQSMTIERPGSRNSTKSLSSPATCT